MSLFGYQPVLALVAAAGIRCVLFAAWVGRGVGVGWEGGKGVVVGGWVATHGWVGGNMSGRILLSNKNLTYWRAYNLTDGAGPQ